MRKLQIASVFSKLPALASFCSVGTNSPSPLTRESKVIPKVGRETTVSSKLVCTAYPLLPKSYPKGLRLSSFLELLKSRRQLAVPLPVSFAVSK